MFRSIREVRIANNAIGHHWFDPGAMRFFNTVIVSNLITFKDRQFFITVDRADANDPIAYAIREVFPDGKIETLGDLRDYATEGDARAAIVKVAR